MQTEFLKDFCTKLNFDLNGADLCNNVASFGRLSRYRFGRRSQ